MLSNIPAKHGKEKYLVSTDQIIKDNTINIIACKNPFTTIKSNYKLLEGLNIIDICKSININYEYVHIFINDKYIKKEDYNNTYPCKNDIIIVKAFLGGDGDGKNPLLTIARIAVFAASLYVGFYWGRIWGMATYFVGNLAVSTLIPPPEAKIHTDSQSGFSLEKTFSIISTSNRMLPFGTVPKVFGEARIWPPKAALPFTNIAGGEQYVTELFCLGPGPLEKSELKIGENNIDNYENVYYEFLTGNQSSFLYQRNTTEKNTNILLPGYHENKISNGRFSTSTPWITQTTEPDTIAVSIDFTCPSGLMHIYSGNGGRYPVAVLIQIQAYISGEWININNGNGYNIYGGSACDMGTFAGDSWGLPISEGWNNVARITGGTSRVVRGYIYFNLNVSGQYEIRVRPVFETTPGYIIDLDDNDNNTYDDVYMTAFRSYSDQEDVSTINVKNEEIEFIALRVKATDQLNGYIDSFNLKCRAAHPIYTGDQWTTGFTSNPAWCYADVLIGSSNKRALSNTRLNETNLLSFAQECESNNFECNGVITGKASVKEILKQIAAVGRATPGMPDEKHGVVMDLEQSTPIQIFTPRNSWNYSAKKVFMDLPHALRCNFVNSDGQTDQVIVYRDNYGSSNSTKYENMDFSLVNNSDQVWKLARYYLAVAELRPEVHQIEVDFEHIVCTRGDLVGLSHDAPSIGSGWCRIKEKSVNGTEVTLTLDDYIELSGGLDYGIVIRTNTIPVSCQIDDTSPSGTRSKIIICTLPTATSSLIENDNLLIWGELNSEYSLMIVKEIIPGPDLSAIIYLVDYNTGIQNADSGEIPSWDSNITWPIYEGVPDPIIESIISNESAMYYNSGGILVNGINVSFKTPTTSSGNNQPIKIEIQYRLYEDNLSANIWEASTVYSLSDKIRPSRKIDQLLSVDNCYHKNNISLNELELLNKVVLKIFNSLIYNYIDNDDIDIDGEIILKIFNSLIYNYINNDDIDLKNLWYNCIVAGTSDSSEPLWWPTNPGDTISDNTITWLCLGIDDFPGTWEDLKGVGINNSSFTIPNVESGGKYQIRIRFWDINERKSNWVSINHTVIGGQTNPSTPSGLNSESFIGGIKFYWNESDEIDFSHWKYRIQVESEGWSSWIKIDIAELSFSLDNNQIELYDYEATIYIELIAYDIFGNNSSTASYNSKTGLLDNYPTAFVVATSTNQGDYTSIQDALNNLSTANKQAIYIKNGTYTLSTSLVLPNVNLDIIGQSQGGVEIIASSSLVTQRCILLDNLTKTYNIRNLTVSLNKPATSTSANDFCIYVTGDASSDNKSNVYINNLNINPITIGAMGIYANKGDGRLSIDGCNFSSGNNGIRIVSYENININNNRINKQNIPIHFISYSTLQNKKFSSISDNQMIYNDVGIHITGDNVNVYGNKITYNTTFVNTYNSSNRATAIYMNNSTNCNFNNNHIDVNINSTSFSTGLTGVGPIRGVKLSGEHIQFTNNNIYISNNTTKQSTSINHTGIDILSLTNSHITNNNIKIENSTVHTSTRIGILFEYNSDRNIVQGNNINLVNNTSKDIGIRIKSGSDNNQGGDNITYNVGVSIDDNGSSNAVTAKDI